jgi:cellulose synthase/poly-beta-1,6-N-acetylglucosamine synthase-like glycosyltransferase
MWRRRNSPSEDLRFSVPFHFIILTLFAATQFLYLFGLLVNVWFFRLPVNKVDAALVPRNGDAAPPMILLYPVLNELEETMRTTFTGMLKAEYPGSVRVVAIPNANDASSIQAFERLMTEFAFLELLPVPATTDPSWKKVWQAWDENPKAYWWHTGKRAGVEALPPKKTRQVIWALYQLAADNREAVLSYIDADSVIPADYYLTAAAGMQQYDVIQNTNISGNLMHSWATSFFAMDHIQWDLSLYPHMSANGKHPYYILGKGVFYRIENLLAIGGFHPWLTIEDPEVGMRLWTNGYRLGIVESPLIEEVPPTFSDGVTQRKRWVAGFFQSLASPLTDMGMPARKRWRARLNFVPTLSLPVNLIGIPLGIFVLVEAIISRTSYVPEALEGLAFINIALAVGVIGNGQRLAYKWSGLVLTTVRRRLSYVFRVNPVFLLGYWLWWGIPLIIGFRMFATDGGLVWERTKKVDANNVLIRSVSTDATQRTQAGEAADQEAGRHLAGKVTLGIVILIAIGAGTVGYQDLHHDRNAAAAAAAVNPGVSPTRAGPSPSPSGTAESSPPTRAAVTGPSVTTRARAVPVLGKQLLPIASVRLLKNLTTHR